MTEKTGMTIKIKQTVLGTVLLLLITHCAPPSNSLTSSQSSGTGDSLGMPTSNVVGGQVTKLSLSSDQLVLDLNLADEEEALLLLVSHNNYPSQTGYEIGTSLNSPENHYAMGQNQNPTEDFHEMLREWEAQIPSEDIEDAVQNPPKFALKYAQVGDSRSFKMIQNFSNGYDYSTLSATLFYANKYFEFYIGDEDLTELSAETKSQMQEVLDDFTNILDKEIELLGEPSDIDGNGVFTILASSGVNKMGLLYGGMITGWFHGTELIYGPDKYPASNQQDIFYVMVPDPKGKKGPAVNNNLYLSNILPSVLAHELQHMINFNINTIQKGVAAEYSWLNENISHLIEDIYSIGENDYMDESGLEQASRTARYLQNIDQVCFIGCGATLEERGGGYLFLRYLYEMAENGYLDAADGKEFIERLMDGPEKGLQNIKEAAFGDESDDESLNTFAGYFATAIYLSDTGASSNALYNIDGLNLRETQDDNRGTVLNGPAVIHFNSVFTNVLKGFSFSYIEISGQDINAQGGSLTLDLGDASVFEAYLVK